jgi:predicted SAM-dependent methyltransferase
LEISDPSAKIAIQGKDYNSWTIIEPNPNPNLNLSEKINYIRCFFDNDFKSNNTYDVLVHSHFMEHSFDPHSFLKKCFDMLPTDGLMVFSIPNMEHLLKVDGIPNNILHFEHTYFYDRDTIQYLLTSNGFEILEKKDYKSHSWFYKCKKNESIMVSNLGYRKYLSDRFLDLHNKHISRISKINEILDQSDPSSCFLFGCHVNSQYYIQNGLSPVSKILDNSKSKQGKVLYGSKYSIDAPSIIKDVEFPVVVCSHTGPYFEEISKQLQQINQNAKIL